MLKILNTFKNNLIAILEGLGSYINQGAEVLKSKTVSQSSLSSGKQKKILKGKNQKQPKNIFYHKGSSYNGKGKVSSDAKIYNHPRKDVPRGHHH